MINKHNTQISNVLVIGSGGAGLRAAIEAKMLGMEVTVIGKRQKNRCPHRISCWWC
jgi:succinate dehydrogenase / fumarate reductase flavoprotein subunit